MDCMTGRHRYGRREDPEGERDACAALARQVRNRQAAALYLRAATTTADAAARELLRKRAAGLISGI